MPRHYCNSENARRAATKLAAVTQEKRRKFEVLYRDLALVLRSKGYSLQQIADYFNQRGQKTRTGKHFSETQVWRLLNRV